MLHNLINKKLNSPAKHRKQSLTITSEASDHYDLSTVILSSPKLNYIDSRGNFNSHLEFLRRSSKKGSIQEGESISNTNLMNLDLKNQKIWELEERLSEVSDLLFSLYEKMKQSLLIDEVYKFFH